jgi:hypothetical protein
MAKHRPPQLNPDFMPSDTTIFRTQHTHSTKLENAEKLRRLERARQWAAELNFDLEGLA